MARGIVYILKNPTYKAEDGTPIVKIGKTGNSIQALRQRIATLSSTGVPGRFTAYAAVSVKDAAKAESLLHKTFQHCHHSKEFFIIKPETAKAALQLTLVHGWSGSRKLTKDIEKFIKNPKDRSIGEPQSGARTSEDTSGSNDKHYVLVPGPPFTFLGLDIPQGATLKFYDKSGAGKGEKAVVEKNNKIRFRKTSGMTLSRAAGIIFKENNINKGFSGPSHWTFEGKSIRHLIDKKKLRQSKPIRQSSQTSRAAFTSFSDLGIPQGATLHFYGKKGIECHDTAKVEGEKTVKFRGEILTLTGATKKVYADNGHPIKTIAGPLHWCYNGDRIRDIAKNKNRA